MKKYRLLGAILVLSFFVFIAGCAKVPLIKKKAGPPVRKKIEKPLAAPKEKEGYPSIVRPLPF